MSESNGIIKMGRRGIKKFQFGDDDGPHVVIEIDVVGTRDDWWQIDANFRNEKREVPPEKQKEHNNAMMNWVRTVIMGAAIDPKQAAQEVAGRISLTDALAFVAELEKQTAELKDFFVLKSPEKPSSSESTEVIYAE